MSVPKWLDSKTPQEMGRRFEKKVAKKTKGRVQPGSGSVPFFKEDVVTKGCLMQLKRTEKSQFTLHLKDLTELCINAAKVGKQPVFILHMGNRNWTIRPSSELD